MRSVVPFPSPFPSFSHRHHRHPPLASSSRPIRLRHHRHPRPHGLPRFRHLGHKTLFPPFPSLLQILQSLFGVLDHLRRSQVAVEHHIAYFQGQTPPGLPPLGYVQPPPHSGYNGLPLPTTDPNTLARKRGPRGAEEEDDGTGKRKRRRGPAGKEKKVRDPDAPKRPPSAYLVFQNEVRKEMQAQYPNTPYHEVLSKISERWAKMTDEEKKVCSHSYPSLLLKHSSRYLYIHLQYYNDQTDIAKKKFTADKAAYDAKRQGQNGTAPLVVCTSVLPILILMHAYCIISYRRLRGTLRQIPQSLRRTKNRTKRMTVQKDLNRRAVKSMKRIARMRKKKIMLQRKVNRNQTQASQKPKRKRTLQKPSPDKFDNFP